jgi:hypothetical protein
MPVASPKSTSHRLGWLASPRRPCEANDRAALLQGPGHYVATPVMGHHTVNSLKPASHGHSFGGRHAKIDRAKTGPQKDAHQKSYIPGPDKYQMVSGMGQQCSSLKPSNARARIGTAPRGQEAKVSAFPFVALLRAAALTVALAVFPTVVPSRQRGEPDGGHPWVYTRPWRLCHAQCPYGMAAPRPSHIVGPGLTQSASFCVRSSVQGDGGGTTGHTGSQKAKFGGGMCYIDRYKTGIIGNALKSNTPVPFECIARFITARLHHFANRRPPPTLFLSAASRARVRTRRRT